MAWVSVLPVSGSYLEEQSMNVRDIELDPNVIQKRNALQLKMFPRVGLTEIHNEEDLNMI
jgi:hypothetical protein